METEAIKEVFGGDAIRYTCEFDKIHGGRIFLCLRCFIARSRCWGHKERDSSRRR